jgi:hypothetical protein
MKRFALSVCGFALVALFLSSVSFAAAPAASPNATTTPAVTAACGETAVATADVPTFLAGLSGTAGTKLATSCGITTCTQAHTVCRHDYCGGGSCTVASFFCNAADPCAFQCSCFCL